MDPPLPSDEDVARWAAEKLADSRLMSLPRDLMGVVMLHVNDMHKQSDRYKDMCALWDKMEKDNNLDVRVCNRCGIHAVLYDAATTEWTREMDWCNVQSCPADMCLDCKNETCAYCTGTYCDAHVGYMHTCKGCSGNMCSQCRDRYKVCQHCNDIYDLV